MYDAKKAIPYMIKCLRGKTFVVFAVFTNRECFTIENFPVL